jgi:hypothetical protein
MLAEAKSHRNFLVTYDCTVGRNSGRELAIIVDGPSKNRTLEQPLSDEFFRAPANAAKFAKKGRDVNRVAKSFSERRALRLRKAVHLNMIITFHYGWRISFISRVFGCEERKPG